MNKIDSTRTTMIRYELASLLKGKYKRILGKLIRLIEIENPTTFIKVEHLIPKVRRLLREVEPSLQLSIIRQLRKSFFKGMNVASLRISKQTGSDFKLSFNVKHKKALDAVQKMSFADVKNVNNDITNYLRRSLFESLDKGEGIQGMKERLNSMFGKYSKKELEKFQRGLKVNPEYRAELISRNSVIKAYNEGTLEQYKQSGFIDKKQWLAGRDERTCPICKKLNGTKVNLDKPFKVTSGGKVYEIMTPPAHPNCRCTLLSVIGR